MTGVNSYSLFAAPILLREVCIHRNAAQPSTPLPRSARSNRPLASQAHQFHVRVTSTYTVAVLVRRPGCGGHLLQLHVVWCARAPSRHAREHGISSRCRVASRTCLLFPPPRLSYVPAAATRRV